MDPGDDSDSQDSQDSQDLQSSSQIPGNPWLQNLKTRNQTSYYSIGTLVAAIQTGSPAVSPQLPARQIRSWLEKKKRPCWRLPKQTEQFPRE